VRSYTGTHTVAGGQIVSADIAQVGLARALIDVPPLWRAHGRKQQVTTIRRVSALAFAGAALTAVLAGGLTASAGAATTTTTASTAVSNRSDSGINGNNWALDQMTRVTTVSRHAQVDPSHCGGTGPCYSWTGQIKDNNGHFTTQVGQLSPGAGSFNGGTEPTIGVAANGTFSGVFHYSFYTTAAAASASNMPATAIGDPPATVSAGHWVEQMFAPSTPFWDANGNAGAILSTTGSWSYTLPLGADAACPNVSSHWVDASPDWGGNAFSGNILAPDAQHC
jgi:hypothetical protein